jgi:hypothetical protein
MEKYLTKSNIVAAIAILVLFGYLGWLYYNVQKEKEIFVIGMCAKNKSPVWRYDYIKNADDIKLELKKDDGIFYKYFKRCEQEYQISPKAMKLKYLND